MWKKIEGGETRELVLMKMMGGEREIAERDAEVANVFNGVWGAGSRAEALGTWSRDAVIPLLVRWELGQSSHHFAF